MSEAPVLSVVVPVRNEEPNIVPLIQEIEAALGGIPHEIVYVDDGSEDGTPQRLAEMAGQAPLLAHYVDAHPAVADVLAQGGIGGAFKTAGKAILFFLIGIFLVGAVIGLAVGFFIGRAVGRNSADAPSSAVSDTP